VHVALKQRLGGLQQQQQQAANIYQIKSPLLPCNDPAAG